MALKERIPTGICRAGFLLCGTSTFAAIAVVGRVFAMYHLLTSPSNRQTSKSQVQVGVIEKIGQIFSDSASKVAPVRRLFGGGARSSRQLQPCIESLDWHFDIRFGLQMWGSRPLAPEVRYPLSLPMAEQFN
jgi:hypothetical protein